MKRLIGLLFLLPVLLHAQETGIHFENGLSWKQILAKAKKENKYIFVDCYATWCGPCKQMDKDVYPEQKVGDFYNTKFISVRYQMDVTANDDEIVKKSQLDSKELDKQYAINAYPAFLFFNPTGKLVHRGAGARSADDLVVLGIDAIDVSKDYYTLLDLFNKGKANLAQTSMLARQALVLGDTVTSKRIASTYIRNLNKDSLLTKKNIEFLTEFTKTSSDVGFQVFYQYKDSIGKIMEDDMCATDVVRAIIFVEMVEPSLLKAKENKTQPDWNALSASVEKKYNKYYADFIITGARLHWANVNDNTKEQAKWLVAWMDNYASKTKTGQSFSLLLNNSAWEIFTLSNNTDELKSALAWSSRAVMMFPNYNWMDTYSNLLYKLGKRDEAIQWEEIALKLGPGNSDLKTNLSKMKEGVPTWTNN